MDSWFFRFIDSHSYGMLKFYDYLKTSETLSYEALQSEQISKAKKLCKNFGMKEIEEWEDFNSLPLTTKKQLRSYVTSAKNCVYSQTTGSTGEPFRFADSETRGPISKATELRNWKRLGWEKQWSVRLTRGRVGKKFRLYNKLLNITCRNYRTVNSSYVGLTAKKPFIIQGGTSAIRELAWLAKKDGVMSFDTKCVVLGEDPTEHIPALEKQFQDVYQQYGLAECVNVAFECQNHSLHVNMENCIAEDIDGELVITNLNNYATPFIRYKTGDRGRVVRRSCKCELETDVIVGLQGKSIGFYADQNLKKPLGWWMLSYLKNNYDDYFKQFRAIAYPNEKRIELIVIPKKDKDETEGMLGSYVIWLSDNTGYEVELHIVDMIEKSYKLFEVVE